MGKLYYIHFCDSVLCRNALKCYSCSHFQFFSLLQVDALTPCRSSSPSLQQSMTECVTRPQTQSNDAIKDFLMQYDIFLSGTSCRTCLINYIFHNLVFFPFSVPLCSPHLVPVVASPATDKSLAFDEQTETADRRLSNCLSNSWAPR